MTNIWIIRCFMLCALVILTACRPGPTESPAPSPTPTIQRVGLVRSAQPARVALDTCGRTLTELALIVEEIPAFSPEVEGLDLIITLEDPPAPPWQAFALAADHLVVVLHPDNPVMALETRELAAIYQGDALRWADVGWSGPGSQAIIEVWDYPEGHPLREHFERAVLEGATRTEALAALAPDPAAMLEAISDNPEAIGYLPAAWQAATLATPRLDLDLQAAFRLPLLASAPVDSNPMASRLIQCLESPIGQTELLKDYESWTQE